MVALRKSSSKFFAFFKASETNVNTERPQLFISKALWNTGRRDGLCRYSKHFCLIFGSEELVMSLVKLGAGARRHDRSTVVLPSNRFWIPVVVNVSSCTVLFPHF